VSSPGTTASLIRQRTQRNDRERRAFSTSGAVAVAVAVAVHVDGLRPGDVHAPSARFGEGEPAYGRGT
jgi:hypothetical protein